MPIGFNIKHKQLALESYSEELLKCLSPDQTHKFYWQKPIRKRKKLLHPAENDSSLPKAIRGQHFESWTEIAETLGYHE